MEKNDLFEKRMAELSKKAYYRGILTYSDFLDLNEQSRLSCLSLKDTGTAVQTFGGYDSAERQMAAFVPDAFSYAQDSQELDYPISCLRICPLNRKFAEGLTHRDYLGAILNLGVERSKIGDILVSPEGAYVFCHASMETFFAEELTRIRHTSVRTVPVLDKEELPKPRREEISGTVASLRLDSITALAFHTSRSSMIPFIEGGKVFVNGKLVVSNGYSIKEEDIISVRGKGKFQFGTTTNITKKNRYHVVLYKYC